MARSCASVRVSEGLPVQVISSAALAGPVNINAIATSLMVIIDALNFLTSGPGGSSLYYSFLTL
jgi:hypothetical protein